MLILNFSHPLTADQLARVEELTHQKISDIRHIPAQFDQQQPFAPQIEAIIAACNLTGQEWQSTPLLIIPPALNFIAVALLAQLHGLMGYFPDCLRLRPVEDARPPRFEVAEILDLQAYRETGRGKRGAE
jgi:hypothetical protein